VLWKMVWLVAGNQQQRLHYRRVHAAGGDHGCAQIVHSVSGGAHPLNASYLHIPSHLHSRARPIPLWLVASRIEVGVATIHAFFFPSALFDFLFSPPYRS